MLKQNGSLFRTSGALPAGTNISDTIGFNNQQYVSQRTNGNCLIDTMNITPALGKRWSVLSAGVALGLGLFAGLPIYGKLGRVVAGLLIGGAVETLASGNIGNSLPLPSAELTADIWNPANDPLPPVTANNNGAVPTTFFSASIALPVPKDILGSVAIGIGIWMLPSLIGAGTAGTGIVGLTTIGARWSVSYDDGS